MPRYSAHEPPNGFLVVRTSQGHIILQQRDEPFGLPVWQQVAGPFAERWYAVKKAHEMATTEKGSTMAQYTVYGIDPSAMGDPVTDEDMQSLQDAINEALANAGLDHRAHVVIGEDAGRYTFLPSESADPELRAVVDGAWTEWVEPQA